MMLRIKSSTLWAIAMLLSFSACQSLKGRENRKYRYAKKL